MTANLEGFAPDEDYLFEIDDAAALRCAYSLLSDEGLALGLSSGTNVAGAMAMARRLAPAASRAHGRLRPPELSPHQYVAVTLPSEKIRASG